MEKLLDEFNNYMDQFKSLTVDDKKEEVYKMAKLLAVMSNEMCKSVGLDDKILVNKELTDINKNGDAKTLDDYLEALLVLLSSTQKSLSDYNYSMAELLEQKSRYY